MTGLIAKLIVCPIAVYLTSVLITKSLYYPAWWMIVLTGFAIAVAGHLMEVWLLSKKTIRLSTALDFGAAAIIVYLSGWVFTGARVTWVGAVVAALLIGIVELLEHYYLTRAGKVER